MLTIRVKFTKINEAAYISLLDLQRVVGRAIKRSGIPAWYSKGFNPHIYMTFATPLSLGQQSECEIMDFKTENENYDWENAKQTLSNCLPRGIDVLDIYVATTVADKIAFAQYDISYNKDKAASFDNACEKYNALNVAIVSKKTKRGTKDVNLKEFISNINAKDGKATIVLSAGGENNINPVLLLGFLETLGCENVQFANIIRKQLLTKDLTVFE